MKKSTLVLKLIPAALLGLASQQASASAFQLLEQNASGLGNAYAGTAAVAEDASTIFYNPAGMALLPSGRQFALGMNAILPSAKFTNGGSTPALGVPPATPQVLGGGSKDAGDWAYLPHGYLAMDLAPNWRMGVGVNAPFGLKTEYDGGWMGRFHAVKSDVKTLNINPSLSFKVSDSLSLGFGVDWQKIDAEFSSSANYSLALYSAVLTATGNPVLAAGAAAGQFAARPEGILKITGSDDAWGYNLGLIYQIDPTSRVGVTYRSTIKYHVTGKARTSSGNALLDAALNKDVYADIELPDTFTLSGQKMLNDRWELLGDIAWTGWSKIPRLDFKFKDTGALLSGTAENWRDTIRVAVGANYKYSDAWKLRFGVAFDQTPVPDANRTPRLPDNDRTWLSFGAQYRLNKDSAIDFGYSHLFVKNSSINDGGASAADLAKMGLLKGSYSNDVNILAVQYSSSF